MPACGLAQQQQQQRSMMRDETWTFFMMTFGLFRQLTIVNIYHFFLGFQKTIFVLFLISADLKKKTD
jgi:hypothetical protein